MSLAAATPARQRHITRVRHARRYTEIVAVLVKYGFADAVRALHLTPYLRAGRRLLAAAGRQVAPEATRAERLRLALEALGPTFVKFGQALSTRTDVLPSAAATSSRPWPACPPASPPSPRKSGATACKSTSCTRTCILRSGRL